MFGVLTHVVAALVMMYVCMLVQKLCNEVRHSLNVMTSVMEFTRVMEFTTKVLPSGMFQEEHLQEKVYKLNGDKRRLEAENEQLKKNVECLSKKVESFEHERKHNHDAQIICLLDDILDGKVGIEWRPSHNYHRQRDGSILQTLVIMPPPARPEDCKRN